LRTIGQSSDGKTFHRSTNAALRVANKLNLLFKTEGIMLRVEEYRCCSQY
jgi:hypothetical protein